MFERFTDRDRKALALANREAQRFRCEQIEPAHMLLGVLHEGSGVGVHALKELSIEPHAVFVEVERMVEELHGPSATTASTGKVPPSPQAHEVLKRAIEEARGLDCNYVGTEHLLLGLLHESESIPGAVLARAGVTPEEARIAVCSVLGISGVPPEPHSSEEVHPDHQSADHETPATGDSGSPLHLFTDRARKVLALANQEAQRVNHAYIGTEHLLLGLVREGRGVGANVLKNLDIDLRRVRLEVEKLLRAGPEPVTIGKLPQTPRAKAVIQYAIEESRNLNHNYVGTEHLLLGLLREGEGVAGQVLTNLGLSLEGVRDEILNLLGPPPSSS